MKATVTGIDPYLRMGTDGVMYRHVFFKTEHGVSCKTHLCPTHGNWDRWKNFLEEGVVLDNLKMLKGTEKIIDGDSYPTLVSRPLKQGELL